MIDEPTFGQLQKNRIRKKRFLFQNLISFTALEEIKAELSSATQVENLMNRKNSVSIYFLFLLRLFSEIWRYQ